METQTTTNHHARSKKKIVHKVAGKAKSAAQKVEHDLTGGVSELVEDGQAKLEQIATGATGFVRRNPKTSVGVALGAGMLIGALIDGRIANLAAGSINGLIKMARKRFF